jgi:hypothetical protein
MDVCSQWSPDLRGTIRNYMIRAFHFRREYSLSFGRWSMNEWTQGTEFLNDNSILELFLCLDCFEKFRSSSANLFGSNPTAISCQSRRDRLMFCYEAISFKLCACAINRFGNLFCRFRMKRILSNIVQRLSPSKRNAWSWEKLCHFRPIGENYWNNAILNLNGASSKPIAAKWERNPAKPELNSSEISAKSKQNPNKI